MTEQTQTATDAAATPDTAVPAAPDTAAPAADLDAKLGEIWDKANNVPAHDDKTGRFVARKAATEDEPEQELADQGDDPEPADEDPDQARLRDEEPDEPTDEDEGFDEADASEDGARPVIPPPNAWSEPMKAMWDIFPPEMQEYFAKRENDAHTTITRLGRELSEYRPLGKLFNDYRDVFLRHGVDSAKGIHLLLEAQRRLDANPGRAIAAIAAQYGIDLAQLANEITGQPEAEGNTDPAVKATREELRQLKRQLAEREQRERSLLEAQTRALQQQTDQDVAAWASDKPYYHEAKVRDLMADYIERGRADTLDEAYDMACNAVPSVRVRIQQQIEREEAAARRAEEQQRREQARRHASEAKRVQSVNTGTVRRSATVPSGKWDDDRNLERIFERAQQAR